MSEICTKNMERNDICPDDTEPIYLKLDSEEGIASLLTMDDFTAVYELADKTRHAGHVAGEKVQHVENRMQEKGQQWKNRADEGIHQIKDRMQEQGHRIGNKVDEAYDRTRHGIDDKLGRK